MSLTAIITFAKAFLTGMLVASLARAEDFQLDALWIALIVGLIILALRVYKQPTLVWIIVGFLVGLILVLVLPALSFLALSAEALVVLFVFLWLALSI